MQIVNGLLLFYDMISRSFCARDYAAWYIRLKNPKKRIIFASGYDRIIIIPVFGQPDQVLYQERPDRFFFAR